MDWIRGFVFAATFVTLIGLSASAGAAQIMKHSGSITAIADDARTFVLTEVGPWQVRDGATAVTHHTITLAPDTQYAIVVRVPAPPSGYAEDFVEFQVGPEQVYLNDVVTVECRHEGKRLVAVKIVVIEVPPPGAAR